MQHENSTGKRLLGNFWHQKYFIKVCRVKTIHVALYQ